MDSFQFIPTNQKNIDQFIQKKPSNIDNKVINSLILLFVIYFVITILLYWVLIINDQSKLRQSILEIDSENSSYYPKGDLEQVLFNLNDLIDKSYNPIPVIKSIESAYIPNSRVRNFVYSKTDKSINFTMIVPSIADATFQVQKFKDIKLVSNVDFVSPNTAVGSSEVTFDVKIRLN